MVAPAHLLGVALALGAAFAAACNRLFVRSGTEEGTAADAFFFVMTISTIVIVPVVAVVYYPAYGITRASVFWFLLAGLVGTLLGNLCLYASIKRIGASRTQPIVASNALIATALALPLLGESLTPIHGTGVASIVLGITVIAWETTREQSAGVPRTSRVTSLLLPFGAAFAFGMEPILANFGFETGTPAPVGLAIKTFAAWSGFTLYFLWKDMLPPLERIRENDGKWFLLAGIAYVLFLVGYYVGLEIAPVNVVTPMIITNVLFVIVLSALFMPERLERVTWRLGAAATAVVIGAVVITVFG